MKVPTSIPPNLKLFSLPRIGSKSFAKKYYP
jgi:hypothetical protein